MQSHGALFPDTPLQLASGGHASRDRVAIGAAARGWAAECRARETQLIYRCRRCGLEERRGFLPTASAALLRAFAVVAGVLAAAFLALVVALVRGRVLAGSSWLGWLGTAFMALCGGALVAAELMLALQLVEFSLVMLRRCPSCRARRWTWGLYMRRSSSA